jgi:hypothetical protein
MRIRLFRVIWVLSLLSIALLLLIAIDGIRNWNNSWDFDRFTNALLVSGAPGTIGLTLCYIFLGSFGWPKIESSP